jgi:hypothetical protein
MYEVCVYEEFGCKLFSFRSYDCATRAAHVLSLAAGVMSVEVRNENDNVMHEYRGENFAKLL